MCVSLCCVKIKVSHHRNHYWKSNLSVIHKDPPVETDGFFFTLTVKIVFFNSCWEDSETYFSGSFSSILKHFSGSHLLFYWLLPYSLKWYYNASNYGYLYFFVSASVKSLVRRFSASFSEFIPLLELKELVDHILSWFSVSSVKKLQDTNWKWIILFCWHFQYIWL